MTAPLPIPMQWDGEHFTPASPYWARQADKAFVVGELYPLEVREERSARSHSHYFACLADAWANLPDHLSAFLPSPEHLRKYALIRCGHCDQRSIVCASKAEAQRMAAFIAPMDTYAVVVAQEAVVTVYVAKSQSMKAMGKREFADSKSRVLDYIAGLIGTTADALAKNVSQAA